MKERRPRPDVEAERRLDALLRSAAGFEPETPAPAGLAARALGSRGRDRAAWGGRIAARAAAVLVLAAISLAVWRVASPPSTRAVRVGAPPQHLAGLPGVPTIAPGPVPIGRPAPALRGVATRAAAEAVRLPAADWPAAWRRARGLRPSGPRLALVRERVVRRYATGILAPVWIARDDPTGAGAITVAPAVVNVPINETIRDEGDPADTLADHATVATMERMR